MKSFQVKQGPTWAKKGIVMKNLFVGLMIAVMVACSGSVNAMKSEEVKVAFSNQSSDQVDVYHQRPSHMDLINRYSRSIIDAESDLEGFNLDDRMFFYTKTGGYMLLTHFGGKVTFMRTYDNRKMEDTQKNTNDILVVINPDGTVQLIDRTKR